MNAVRGVMWTRSVAQWNRFRSKSGVPGVGMMRIVDAIAFGFVVSDRAYTHPLEGGTGLGTAASTNQLGLEGNEFTLIRGAVGTAGSLGVRDVLRDDVEPGFLGVERAGRYVDAGD